LQNTINFPDDRPIIFQVLDCSDACNERETLVAVQKLTIQVDGVDPGTGKGKQFIGVSAAK